MGNIRWDISFTINNIYDRPEKFHASADCLPLYSPRMRDRKLIVEGVIVGKVRVAFPILLESLQLLIGFKSRQDGILVLEDLIQALKRDHTPCVYGSGHAQAIGLTPFAPSDFQNLSHILAGFEAYRTWHNLRWVRAFYRRLGKYDYVVSYFRGIASLCGGRSFFVTEDGYYGLAPWITEPGDICCVLLGSDVPFMLRSNEPQGNEETYKLVGECYLHGYMNGEAIEGMHNGRLQRTLFNIS